MANDYRYRKEKLRMIGGYFEKEIKADVRAIAKREGKTEKELLEEFILDGILSRIKKKKKR